MDNDAGRVMVTQFFRYLPHHRVLHFGLDYPGHPLANTPGRAIRRCPTAAVPPTLSVRSPNRIADNTDAVDFRGSDLHLIRVNPLYPRHPLSY
jgi:hypothetical protein